MTLIQRRQKIRWKTIEDFCEKVNALKAYKLLSIQDTIPDTTDNFQWNEVHYLEQE